MSRQVNLGQIVPNIQIGTTSTGSSGSQASVVNVGTSLNPILNFTIPKGDAGAIKMQIVNELPQTGNEDTIYLVPLEEPESEENRYSEYVWINSQWELLGKIGIEADLTNYYTKNESDTLLNDKLNISKVKTTISTTSGDVYDVTYINSIIGDISSALDTINGEVI